MIKFLLLGLFLLPISMCEAQIKVAVGTDRDYYFPYDTIHITITATNLLADTLLLSFGSTCQSNYHLDTFNLADHTGCLLILTGVKLPPFASHSWQWNYPHYWGSIYPLEPGEHTLIGEVIGYGTPDTLLFHVLPSTSVIQTSGQTQRILVRPCYPNPANGSAAIPFTLPAPGRVRIALFDLLGRQMTAGLDDIQAQGEHSIEFDVSHLPSGLYLVRFQFGAYVEHAKLLVTK